MIDHRHATRVAVTSCVLGLALLLPVTGCSPAASDDATPQTSSSPEAGAGRVSDTIATPSSSEDNPLSPQSSDDLAPTEQPTTTRTQVPLVLWTVEEVSSEAEGKVGESFVKGLSTFETAYPNTSVSAIIKNESGGGSVLDYLRTAGPVAPSVLPDLVVLDTDDLADAYRSGTVVPLDELIAPELVDDLLPGARAAGIVDGNLVGIPFELDSEHLIYNTNKVPESPITWSDVLSASSSYVFPAKGRNGLVNDAFLIQYLSAGGHFLDAEDQPVLDEQVLGQVLEYYQQGSELDIIPPEVLEIGSASEIWPSYVAAEVGMAHVNARNFLIDRDVLRSTNYLDIPTRDGLPLTIARGRALAIATNDPVQQEMAARLIEWLMAGENNALWSESTGYLPTRYAAFKLLDDGDPYWAFLRHLLETAVPPPSFIGYDQYGRVLQQAVVEVLSGEATPEEATAAAMDAVAR